MMQVQDGLPLGCPGLDKAHVRSLHRLADGLGIIAVVLVGFQVRLTKMVATTRTVCPSPVNSRDR